MLSEGEPTSFEDFFTGFLIMDKKAHFGILVRRAVHADGSLWFRMTRGDLSSFL